MKTATGLIAVLFFLNCLSCKATDVTELHIGRDQAQSIEVDTAIAVLKKAYARIGVTPIFEPYPLRRSLAMANAGQLDGDTMRFDQTFSAHPNLIQIRVPLVQIKTAAFMRQASCPATISWPELEGRYVSYERGIMLYEVRLAQAKSVHAMSAEDALHLLSQGSSEVAVSLDREADIAMQSGRFGNLCKVGQPIETTPLYHALNKKHADIAEKLQAVLKEMEARGDINAIWKAAN